MVASVTYTFVPGQDIDSGEVNQNFEDLVDFINGIPLLTTPIPITEGGTGATNRADALANLGGAPLANPDFTGTPTSTTPVASNNSTRIATTEFVRIIVPAGVVLPYAGPAPAPQGWQMCGGQSLDTSTFADLFAVIGYTFGGAGANFNVPDLRGRVAAGVDNMAGSAANRLTLDATGGCDGSLADSGGEQSHVQTIAEMATHTHGTSGPVEAIIVGGTIGTGGSYTPSPSTINDAGGGNAANIVQPTLVLNYMIKT